MSRWTEAEDAIMFEHYAAGGPLACRRAGLKRSKASMVSHARVLCIRVDRRAAIERKAEAEPVWAVPRHDLLESLDCIRLRKWRGPVNKGVLRWVA